VNKNYARPKWWQLYLTFPLLIALFMLDHRLVLPQSGHIAVQVGILLLVYGLVHLWLSANSKALLGMDRGPYYGSVIVTRIPPYQMTDVNKRPMFQLPDSELKGVLSDTFEMDYIDAKLISVEETAQNLKQE
jgi:hypothetical protein